MPTGHALDDPRRTLFDAAERVLLRDGASSLTSRAVTAEAGCAKGVLHRHFADFDAFLADLILDRVALVEANGQSLAAAAGQGDLVDNVTGFLTTVWTSVGVAIVSLMIARDPLRARLRAAGQEGLPVLTQAAEGVKHYLAAEQALGRLAPAADPATLALAMIGTSHMIATGGAGGAPKRTELRRAVSAVIAGQSA